MISFTSWCVRITLTVRDEFQCLHFYRFIVVNIVGSKIGEQFSSHRLSINGGGNWIVIVNGKLIIIINGSGSGFENENWPDSEWSVCCCCRSDLKNKFINGSNGWWQHLTQTLCFYNDFIFRLFTHVSCQMTRFFHIAETDEVRLSSKNTFIEKYQKTAISGERLARCVHQA